MGSLVHEVIFTRHFIFISYTQITIFFPLLWQVHSELRKWLRDNVGVEVASSTRIIYGGNYFCFAVELTFANWHLAVQLTNEKSSVFINKFRFIFLNYPKISYAIFDMNFHFRFCKRNKLQRVGKAAWYWRIFGWRSFPEGDCFSLLPVYLYLDSCSY